ncbi:NAD-dependent epimerase/dehydratase family protein [Rhodophyticola porphyridii]|uniref:NAD(P)-dependent oxidoreductase n=1 Tax=Rhodophyticola porphyridii TaxID=1852017 RepID=A0A3L9Y892_9RHOB|nr:NAD(P)-dependent oxidoreductase [Rhodophyticola porphyridii]RMA42296.1 NAD(P)-dependent oxidoreductase [Rhodophyticola porphyridii]
MSEGPVLVTGAGGFVCSEIALALHRAGRQVLAADRHFDSATAARLGTIRRIEGPLDETLPALVALAPSAVIHGAAITAAPERLGLSRAVHIRRNTELLTRSLEMARSSGARAFLFLSSMGVFEPQDAPAPGGRFTEATTPTALCAYAAAKRAGELLTEAAAEDGFATSSLRLGNVFGPHEAVRESRQTLCLVQRMLAEARSSGVITVDTPEACREWSWLPDLADGIAAHIGTIAANGARVLHAGTPPVQSDLALARAIAERLRGTLIRLAPPPHRPVRPPMGSDHGSVFTAIHWTGMEAALDRLVPVEAAL